MTSELIQALAGNAGAVVLLGLMLIWYLPQRDRRHAETVRRIVEDQRSAIAALERAIDRNSQVLAAHSRACFVRTLSDGGMLPADALMAAEQQIPVSEKSV